MVAKKKILFFMWSFSLGGGAEKILSTIVSNLDPEKYDIDIQTGEFGTDMDVEIINDGPVTIIYESQDGKVI